jgi:outer membrane immunogenic protein
MRFRLAALAAAAFSIGATHAASAADIPARAPMSPKAPAMIVANIWSGCYFGGNAGAAVARTSLTHTPTGDWSLIPADTPFLVAHGSSTFDVTGFTGGGQLGCNWQVSPEWMVGAEVDGEYLGLSESTSFTAATGVGATGIYTQETRLKWLATARARTGLVSGRWLFFVTGGVAFADVSVSQSILFNATGSLAAGNAQAVKTGWTAGGGWEYAVTDNWFLRGEYLYVDLESISANLFNPTFPTFTHTVDSNNVIHIGRAALSYKF